MRTLLAAVLATLLFIAACGHPSEPSKAEKHYALAGEVMALNNKDQTATIKHGQVGNWMGPMTMEYPIHSKTDFQALRVGEKITATVDVLSDTEYTLSAVREQGPGK